MDRYKIGEHIFGVEDYLLMDAVKSMQGFAPFLLDTNEQVEFKFRYAEESVPPVISKCLYEFEADGVKGRFGEVAESIYILSMKHERGYELHLWSDGRVICLQGSLYAQMLRFALWVGYGLMTVSMQTIAIHSSCIVCNGKAVLFLGESGTGKSTHTRLWREHIEEATLLNDDSPILRVEGDGVYLYGSPWSGKTPCYRAERYQLAGVVRLSQAPYNRIKRLSVVQGYAALHPSCPPEFAYSEHLYDAISKTLSQVLKAVPVYHLACLPDAEAARLSYQTIFGYENL